MNNRKILIPVLVVIILAAFFLYDGKSDEVQISQTAAPVKKEITVYVSGQVKTPAVITLEDNGKLRAVDAVNAVGGLTELADTEIVNLAEPLLDGQHIHIPTKEIIFQELPAAVSTSGKSASFAQGNLININTADEKELQNIRGVGPVIASRIVEYRTINGAFQSVEEIKKVRGIGEKTFQKMKDSITVR